MRRYRSVSIFAVLAALAGCTSSDEEGGNAAIDASNGTVTVSAPGFNMALDLPASVAREIEISTDGDALYPGAKAETIRMTKDPGTGQDKVDVGFTANDPLDTVVKWYSNPERSGAFKMTGHNITDGVHTMSAIDESGENFAIVLKQGEGGGTSGTLKFTD